jgi:hypothetical protein
LSSRWTWTLSTSSWIGPHESRLDTYAEEAEVREPIELMDRPEASDSIEEEEPDRFMFMNEGRGGARDPNPITPCSSTCISRMDVSASADSRS